MATRSGDVAGSVREVIAAFDKAVKLVRRIEDQKDGKKEQEAMRDLFKSLSLGPVIVQGYFDADSKRFGQSYLFGDYQAQVELRDVLLGLKSLVGELQDVLLDDSQIDFRQLQETSDACRSNAGVCLGQLSQRLAQARSDPAGMQFQNPPSQYMSGVPSVSSSGLHYSSSRSTYSSGGRMPKTPEPFVQQHALSPQWQPKRSDSNEHYFPQYTRHNTDASPQDNYDNWSQTSQLFTERDSDELSMRRPSSHCLSPEDGALLSSTHSPDDFSPVLPEQHGPFLIDRSSTQSVTSYASRANHGVHNSLEHISEDYRQSDQPRPLRLPHRPSRQALRQASGGPAAPPPRKPIPPVPYELSTGQTPTNRKADLSGRIPTYMHGQKVPIPPRSQSRLAHDAGTPQRILSPEPRAPPFQLSPEVQRAMQHDQMRRQYNPDRSLQHAPPPQSQPQSTTNLVTLHKSSSNIHLNTSQQLQHPQLSPQPRLHTASTPSITSTSIPLPQNLPLTLPTERSTHPFCKGAFRLFLGLTKKAFTPANRPVGMSSFIPYWRCDKCLFEGPMHTTPGPPDKKGRPGKPEKIFDPATRECGPLSMAVVGPDGRGEGSGGVRYKWVFLAKSHVPLRTVTEGRHDGTFGGFACLFCAAEGQQRGWTTGVGGAANHGFGVNGSVGNDASSTLSGKSGHSSNNGAGTPVFGNLTLFMDHLQMHRREENWPCAEMLGRMKCVVGRVAERGDDWEVNFLPL
ncbi:hypothetical protein PMZ80_008157 [Knufia obscura]|uniref:Uncharacterized protein n=1 Tax=Knufia obscura TaxID=1635080 RepID=A0ABR0RGM7_9EURO|nr:hypothetical protein PMZ80_008157 [Knufia obscura]